MVQVKIFFARESAFELEENINKWVEEFLPAVSRVDIQAVQFKQYSNMSAKLLYWAWVSYEKYENY